jgi:hypothetical protein
VLSSAYALKNLEDWEFKVADKVQRLLKYFDGRCGESPEDEQGHIRGQAVDFRAWSNFFTMDAIVDIGLSKSLGFLDRGDDLTTSEGLDGTLCEVGYRESLHCNLTVQSHLIWAYDWYQTIIKWIGLISTKYQNLISKGSAFDGIVLHQARHRLKRYQDGEKLDDFFQALMEKKDGSPNCLEFGEIFAEINIMRKSWLQNYRPMPLLIDLCSQCRVCIDGDSNQQRLVHATPASKMS